MKKMIFVAFVLLATSAFAGNDKTTFTYLALGDSIPFGMNILLVLPPFATQKPTPSEFVGYPETVEAVERLFSPRTLVNASCPGETSGSFLNVPDNVKTFDIGCNSPHLLPPGSMPPSLPAFRPTIGLKVEYGSPQQSQMEFAEAQLASNKQIDMITLSIGANDVFLVLPALQQCGTNVTCQNAILSPTLGAYAANLNEILTRIRIGAKYKGKLVLLTYYSPDPTLDALAVAVNATMTQVASQKAFAPVHFADGFRAFKTASAFVDGDACKAGLLIRFPTPPGAPLMCDIHPSPIGRDLLAAIVEIALHQ